MRFSARYSRDNITKYSTYVEYIASRKHFRACPLARFNLGERSVEALDSTFSLSLSRSSSLVIVTCARLDSLSYSPRENRSRQTRLSLSLSLSRRVGELCARGAHCYPDRHGGGARPMRCDAHRACYDATPFAYIHITFSGCEARALQMDKVEEKAPIRAMRCVG